MTLADQIRAHAVRRYIQPARRSHSLVPTTVTIVAGDVVREMKLQKRCPAVSGAFDAKKFQEEQRIKLLARGGPRQGPSATWRFLV